MIPPGHAATPAGHFAAPARLKPPTPLHKTCGPPAGSPTKDSGNSLLSDEERLQLNIDKTSDKTSKIPRDRARCLQVADEEWRSASSVGSNLLGTLPAGFWLAAVPLQAACEAHAATQGCWAMTSHCLQSTALRQCINGGYALAYMKHQAFYAASLKSQPACMCIHKNGSALMCSV